MQHEPTPRREAWPAALYLALLVWINGYVCRDMFYGATAHMNSMHGFWTALVRHIGEFWYRAAWWPFWDLGIPFEATYPPLVPAVGAAIAAARGVPAAVGFHSVTGLFYILGPATLFVMAWRLTRAPGWSFFAALCYSLTSVTQVLAPENELVLAKLFDARRLFIVATWDDTPHMAALAFLPLAILLLVRTLEKPRAVYAAGAALAIAGAALASAFGPVMVALAAACLLPALRREQLRRNLLLTAAIGAWGWAMAAPFLSPTLAGSIHAANAASDVEGWSVESGTALAVTILGATILGYFLRRATPDWRLRFFGLFAWVTASIPLEQLLLGRHWLPQPLRYRFEMEWAVSLALVFALRPWVERLPANIRRALLFLVVALAADLTAGHRRIEKQVTFPMDARRTVEYRAAAWAAQNHPEWRFFLPGSVGMWANSFFDVRQFAGGSFSMAINQQQQNANAAIVFGGGPAPEDARRSLTWLKAFGVDAVGVSARDSQEYWRAFTNPAKFEGVLPALWSDSGVTIYRVPVRETGIAHVVPRAALAARPPRAPEDVAAVERYVAALDDASLPSTTAAWEGWNRLRIHAAPAPGQVVTVQTNYHPGWHAVAAGRARPVRRDALGLLWLDPACEGPCEIVLDYDGGWELRLCRWLSWGALLAAAVVCGAALTRRWPYRSRR